MPLGLRSTDMTTAPGALRQFEAICLIPRMKLLKITDLRVIESEPRVLDLRLAELLGFSRPRDIRKLIERNRDEIERHGTLRHHGATPAGGGPEATEYWLNKAQALLVCILSDAPRAEDARTELIELFLAWERGDLIPRHSQSSATLDDIGELFDRKLAPIHKRLESIEGNTRTVADRLSNIVPRHDFGPTAKRQVCLTVLWEFGRKCPIDRQTIIVDEHGEPLNGVCEFDHWHGRENQNVDNCFPCSTETHERLGSREFRDAHEHVFKGFHYMRRKLSERGKLEKPKKLKPIKRGSKTINVPGQKSWLN